MLSGGLALAVATEQLAVADDALALRADVDEDLVLVDPDDVALDDVAVLEALDVGVLLGEQLLHRRRLGAEVARRRGRLGLVLGGRGVGGCRRLRPSPRRRGGLGGGLVGSAAASARASAAASGSAAASASAAGSALGASAAARTRPRSTVGSAAPRRRSMRLVGAAARGGLGRRRRPRLDGSAARWSSTARWTARRSASAPCGARVVGSPGWRGSSATATAPAGSVDASVATDAVASVSGAVPPCCSSVNGLVTPGGGFAPENHERPERCSGRGPGTVRGGPW